MLAQNAQYTCLVELGPAGGAHSCKGKMAGQDKAVGNGRVERVKGKKGGWGGREGKE